MKLLSLIIILFSIRPSFAQEVTVKVVAPVRVLNYALGIGSHVQLHFKSKNKTQPAIFLGRMVSQNGRSQEFLFLDEKQTRILMIDPSNLDGFNKAYAQTVISPIDQIGSTCAAYGFFHFWNQIYATRGGNQDLRTIMSSDRGRMQFLEEAIDTYYIRQRTNITNMMKNYGKRYGFSCKSYPFTDPRKAADFIFKVNLIGQPVLIDFFMGSSEMVSSTYEVTDFETPVTRDRRIWIPRKVGERSKIGHVIVAAVAFISNGRRKLLVLDSNWAEPRVWDLERYLSARTAVKYMGFHACR